MEAPGPRRRRGRRARSAPSPTASTPRPGSAPSCRSCSRAGSARTGHGCSASTSGRQRGARRLPDEELWEAHRAQKRRLARFLRSRLRDQFARHGLVARRAALDRDALRPRGAHHRLRAPLRHLQARRPALLRPPPPAPAGRHPRTGRCRSSSPARRTRPTRPARSSSSTSSSSRRRDDAPRPRLLRRGLRHAGRPDAGAGRRRLAQHAAPAARGVRHLGHEGGDERRAQLLDRRRLVARGLRRRERLGDRRAPGGRGRTTTPLRTARTRSRSTACSRRRSSPPSTSATSAACRCAGSR